MYVLKPLLFALALLVPATVQAQAWATREACTVTTAEIDPLYLPSKLLTILQDKVTKLPNPRGRFWRIQSPDGAISHLWGSMRSNDPLILDLPVIVQKRIAGAQVVALEFDPVSQSREAINEHQKREIFRSTTSTFNLDNSGLKPVVLYWIRSRLDGLGWGGDTVDFLSLPFIVENLLSDPCDDFASGALPDQNGMIQTLGLIGGASILGLEPPNALTDYLKVPQNRDTALSILAVYGAYRTPKNNYANRPTSFALYLQGETALEREWQKVDLIRNYGGELAEFHSQRAENYLLDQRNKTFLQTALPDLQQGGVFMAIGSFHLPGEQGMIEMLRQAGYTVSRIPLPGETPDAPAGETQK